MRTTAPPRSRPPVALQPGREKPPLPELHVPRPAWQTVYTALLVAFDAAAMAAATLTAKISWLGINPESFHVRSVSIPYGALALLTVPTWIVLLALAGAYDLGPFGTSPRSWIQVVRSGARLLALIALSYYILHLEMLGRGVLVGLVPLAVALTLAERTLARFGLDQLRRRGRARRTALVVGPRHVVDGFARQVDAHPAAGVSVAGVALLGPEDGSARRSTVPSLPSGNGEPAGANGSGSHNGRSHGVTTGDEHRGDPCTTVARALARTGAESVIVTGGLEQGQVRDIAWMLEGTGIALLVTPAPADMPGVRSTMRPVAGLPLLYLDR